MHILQSEQHCLYDFLSLMLTSNKRDGVWHIESFIVTSKVLVLLTCTVLPYLEHAMGKNAMVRHGALVLFSISLPSTSRTAERLNRKLMGNFPEILLSTHTHTQHRHMHILNAHTLTQAHIAFRSPIVEYSYYQNRVCSYNLTQNA